MNSVRKYRLVTRSDFDGLVCAVLLKELDMIEDITFVHPKDMQDGKVDITDHDITTNVPYTDNALLAFDHHISEVRRLAGEKENLVLDSEAPSASRVVWDSFGGKERFPHISEEMLRAVDKADSARFTVEDVFHPTGWVLMNFIMDARTGLGRFRHFRISNYQLMMDLIDHCRTKTIEEILIQPDVRERIDLLEKHRPAFIDQVRHCTRIHGNVGVTDLREEDIIYTGNRFMVYALFPEINLSMHVMWGRQKQNVVFACGHSIFNRTSEINLGELMLEYGGGGHANAATCQIPTAEADARKMELIGRMKAGR